MTGVLADWVQDGLGSWWAPGLAFAAGVISFASPCVFPLVPGYLSFVAGGEVLAELTAQEAKALLKKADLGASATRALEHALRSLASGVGRAHLVSRRAQGAVLLELFTHSGVGTMITADPVQKLRPARVEDIGAIISLIEPLEADGTLVKRSRELLERELGNFQVVEHDGVLLGCAALYPYPSAKSAEFACVAVTPDYRDAGVGELLLQLLDLSVGSVPLALQLLEARLQLAAVVALARSLLLYGD